MRNYTIINVDPTLQNNLMAFGFECDKGWHPMIIELLDKIQDMVNNNPEEYLDLRIMQIKEKFGGLRVYTNFYDEDIELLLSEYEEKSNTICEICGRPGELRENHFWLKTLCDKCNEKWFSA